MRSDLTLKLAADMKFFKRKSKSDTVLLSFFLINKALWLFAEFFCWKILEEFLTGTDYFWL